MPKMKTNRAATKRFRRTKNGNFTRSHAYSRHLKSAKSSKRRRNLRGCTGLVDAADMGAMAQLFPYNR